MKTAKLGAIFMVSVVGLAFVGAGYAHWYDGVYVYVTADMGYFGIGFVSQRTNDPYSLFNTQYPYGPDTNHSLAKNLDPDQPDSRPRNCSEDLPPHPTRPKDYAWTRCWLSGRKYWHDGTLMYHDNDSMFDTIIVQLGNVYPNYAPNLYFEIANAGTLAADIAGHWLIEGPPGVYPNISSTWINMSKCTMYAFDLTGDNLSDIEIGFFMNFTPTNPNQPQQIDPCQQLEYGLSFHILQPYPECTTTTFKFKIRALNYNWEVCDFDDPDGNGGG
jgi:hypothetical protein